MSTQYRTITAIIGLITLLSISHLGFARERFFERAINVQEADKQLATIADILATTKLWQNNAVLISIFDVEVMSVGIGGNFGRGILMARNNGQNWGNPIFVRVASRKIETPDGNELTFIFMTFKDQQDLDTLIKNGSIDAETAQIYAYEGQSFTQVALTGLINLEINHLSNTKFYGQRVDVTDVISGKISTDSETLKKLMAILNP